MQYVEGLAEQKIDPKMFELSKANWDEYRGNNHKKIPHPNVYAGGGVDLGSHLGKPLSQRLWEDLVHRMVISGLGVYGYNDMQWCVGRPEGYCIINLDENNNVWKIYVVPYQSDLRQSILVRTRVDWMKVMGLSQEEILNSIEDNPPKYLLEEFTQLFAALEIQKLNKEKDNE